MMRTLHMPALLEAGNVDSASSAEAVSASFVPWRLLRVRLSVQQEADILLRARFAVGDAVIHTQYGWQGVVEGLWVEGDGVIWISVRRPSGRCDGFCSFSSREDNLWRDAE